MVGGQTLPLLIMQISKMPILLKISTNQKINYKDCIVFVVYFLITLLNSRKGAIVPLFQIMIASHYCGKPLEIAKYLPFVVVIFLTIFGYGFLRDYANFYSSYNWEDISDFYEKSDLFGNFYRLQVEGYSGFAGIMSNYFNQGISFDYGFFLSQSLKIFNHPLRFIFLKKISCYSDNIFLDNSTLNAVVVLSRITINIVS